MNYKDQTNPNDPLTFIVSKYRLDKNTVKLLELLPEAWWRKCEKAIKVAKFKKYPLEVNIESLLDGKPNPNILFSHKYIINRETKKYKHIISLQINI